MLHTTTVPCRALSVLLLGALLCGSASAATPQQVNQTLNKAKAFLFSKQKPDGTWEVGPPPKDIVNAPGKEYDITGPQYGGLTALVTYSMLASGEKHQDERLKRAIQFLKNTKMAGNYAAGFRAMVWLYLPPTAEVRQLAKIDAEILLGTANKKTGTHTYSLLLAKAQPAGDMSNSQIGLLGLWAAGELGVEVPFGYWTTADQLWRMIQHADGAWSYAPSNKPGAGESAPHPGLTGAGIASLFLINERKQQSGECRGNPQEEAIDKARAWLAANFDNIMHSPTPRVGGNAVYNLYALERCGVAGGYRNFGKHDWYQFAADWLIKNQQPDGRWSADLKDVDLDGVATTAFGMLVLTYGRAPLVMSKLEYFLPDSTPVRSQPARPLPAAGPAPGKPPVAPPVAPPAVQIPQRPAANWNQRPRDAANVTKWIGTGLERLLQWQIVNLDAPLPELLDAPILYIAGNQPLHFNQQELEKLRQYCEHGGLILGNADCGARVFAESFRQLGMTLFDKKYEFRELPADHPIYTRQQFNRTRWRVPPRVHALSNEVRELMVLLPDADASRYWQMQVVKGNDAMHELAADVFLYLYGADKKDIRYKGETHLIARPTTQPAQKTVQVARLRYGGRDGGNWDPEPVAWEQLGNQMLSTDRVELVTTAVEPGQGQLGRKYALAHLTGTAAFTLPETARKELRQYVEGGGTLLMEAAGGRTEFAGAMERELNEIFGEAARKSAVLPQDHELYKVAEPIERFLYRSYARKILGAMSGPRLRGFEVNGRLAVLVSSEDISAGLMGSPVDGIAGYDPATARAVGRRVVLYATKAPAAAPATAPTTAQSP